MQETIQPLPSSFRDPSGFVFQKEEIVYRQVNKIFKEDFDHFINSGCYDQLTKNEWLIPHEEINENILALDDWYKTLKPQRIPFITYPYEWSFDMLKDAALLSLHLVTQSLPFGVVLKDATPFNVQWLNGKPVFIDTLSFEKYDPLKPWIAYRQFCENFLSPLLLMHYTGQSLQSLLLACPQGIPLSLTRKLLPWRSKFSFYTYLHIHLQERLASKSSGKEPQQQNDFSEKKFLRLIDSLQSLIQSLHWKTKTTTWENYYEEANERNDYVARKKKLINEWINEIPGLKTGIDVGSNDGKFSYLLSEKNINTIAVDFDHPAINKLYLDIKKQNEKNILPLLNDIANPSPAIGFLNKERNSFIERTNADITLALALIHHLAIGKNIPFEKMAELFETLTTYLIVEFIPKEDEKIQFMLKQKKDIYNDYSEENFARAFERYFVILKKEAVGDSGRIIYLMKKI
jgi:hypothetical protein